jgi:hypothetical protein
MHPMPRRPRVTEALPHALSAGRSGRAVWCLAWALAVFLAAWLPAQAATNIYKCVEQGRVTYQNDPCSTGAPGPRPTVEQLNAQRKKQQQQAGQAAPSSRPQEIIVPSPVPAPGSPARPAAGPTAPAERSPFACDGRRFCSQMRSCAEAKFFLARCPHTEMDGDGDGIPCEKQWCH